MHSLTCRGMTRRLIAQFDPDELRMSAFPFADNRLSVRWPHQDRNADANWACDVAQHRQLDRNFEMIAKPRLIATDLDGTLLRSDSTISERTRATIHRAQTLGVHVVLVSARAPRSVRGIAGRLGIDGLSICCNGAVAYDISADMILRNERLPTKLALELAAMLRAENATICFATEHGHKIGYEANYPQDPTYIHIHKPAVAPLDELCVDEITKLLIHYPGGDLDQLVARVSGKLGNRASVTHSGGPFAEVCAAGVSKASGLTRLCEDFGVSREQVVAFGDMPNDLPMLEFAGHGVAVRNAHPNVLSAAKEVAPTNDEDGVAQVIERLLQL